MMVSQEKLERILHPCKALNCLHLDCQPNRGRHHGEGGHLLKSTSVWPSSLGVCRCPCGTERGVALRYRHPPPHSSSNSPPLLLLELLELLRLREEHDEEDEDDDEEDELDEVEADEDDRLRLRFRFLLSFSVYEGRNPP